MCQKGCAPGSQARAQRFLTQDRQIGIGGEVDRFGLLLARQAAEHFLDTRRTLSGNALKPCVQPDANSTEAFHGALPICPLCNACIT